MLAGEEDDVKMIAANVQDVRTKHGLRRCAGLQTCGLDLQRCVLRMCGLQRCGLRMCGPGRCGLGRCGIGRCGLGRCGLRMCGPGIFRKRMCRLRRCGLRTCGFRTFRMGIFRKSWQNLVLWPEASTNSLALRRRSKSSMTNLRTQELVRRTTYADFCVRTNN